MHFFRETTKGSAVVMGWNTFKSIGKPLAGRFNIVVSDNAANPVEGVQIVKSLEDAYKVASKYGYKRIFNIGGAKTYRNGLYSADRILLTIINSAFDDADAFFPQLQVGDWVNTKIRDIESNGYTAEIFEYVRSEKKHFLADIMQDFKDRFSPKQNLTVVGSI
jgi:dihydrofolate reductase